MALLNPMVAEESVLRGGLLPGLLGAARHNLGHRHPWLRLFEIGDVFALPGVATEGGSDSAPGDAGGEPGTARGTGARRVAPHGP